MSPFERQLKRSFDVVVATALLILLFPVLVIVGIWIFLDSRGPVLLHQRRIGISGRPFYMHKFRTMRWEPDTDNQRLKHRDDPRITRAGSSLRRSSLDELPQLWNVIVGEMSLVGPRPELPWIAARYEDWQRERFKVPPGITGWWQVTARGERQMHLNTDLDLYYVRHYSFLLDLKILAMTVAVVLRGRGAY